MNFHVLTLFPEMITSGLNHSITGRALTSAASTSPASTGPTPRMRRRSAPLPRSRRRRGRISARSSRGLKTSTARRNTTSAIWRRTPAATATSPRRRPRCSRRGTMTTRPTPARRPRSWTRRATRSAARKRCGRWDTANNGYKIQRRESGTDSLLSLSLQTFRRETERKRLLRRRFKILKRMQ